MANKLLVALALLGPVVFAGCSGFAQENPQNTLPAIAGPSLGNPVSRYIKHVVVIVQENRSFENLFAGYPGADAPMSGKAGTTTVPLHAITFDDGPDLKHDWRSSVLD